MSLDVRIPIGGMFAIIGFLLAGYGVLTGGEPIYEQSLFINVNLWWGLALLAFGLGMFFFGYRAGHHEADGRVKTETEEPPRPFPALERESVVAH